jgi:ATP-dependent DNA helicase RecQ
VDIEPLEILKKYWGYSSFRPQQQEVIASVLEGKDTLALMATGSGKSLCYQVPAMAIKGVCLVISPLISLMKDQSEDLEQRAIKAKVINSSLFASKVEAILNAAVSNRLKILFIAPERIRSNAFMEAFKQMKVGLIVVDEAHCISIWGHDFRPAFLDIAKLRPYHPNVPILALTATATQRVKGEIQSLLQFRQNNIIQATFLRSNFNYMVLEEHNKAAKIASLYQKLEGSGLVYARSRANTEKIARDLQRMGLNALAYHAGLSMYDRNARQNLWKEGKLPLIVATTAFGMGINKADVRYVIHVDIPENIETYFQETGRAGRDGKETFALLLYQSQDKEDLRRRVSLSYPETEYIRSIYNALFSFFDIPFGSGKANVFAFSLSDFVMKYRFQPFAAFNALQILEHNGFIVLNEEEFPKSKAMILVKPDYLRDFTTQYPQYYALIDYLWREYSAIMSEMTYIDESRMAKSVKQSKEQVIKDLQYLVKYNILDYEPKVEGQHITFLQDRLPDTSFVLPQEYLQLKQSAMAKAEMMIEFIEKPQCRQQQILAYFAENVQPCGKCDVCHSTPIAKQDIKSLILQSLQSNSQPISFFSNNIHLGSNDSVMPVLRAMIDDGLLELKDGFISLS